MKILLPRIRLIIIISMFCFKVIAFNDLLLSKDARLPDSLQRTMAAEAEAGRAARAKVRHRC